MGLQVSNIGGVTSIGRHRGHEMEANILARQNYGYEKRQKELAKLKKREVKRQRKLNKKAESPEAPKGPLASGEAPQETPDGEAVPGSF